MFGQLDSEFIYVFIMYLSLDCYGYAVGIRGTCVGKNKIHLPPDNAADNIVYFPGNALSFIAYKVNYVCNLSRQVPGNFDSVSIHTFHRTRVRDWNCISFVRTHTVYGIRRRFAYYMFFSYLSYRIKVVNAFVANRVVWILTQRRCQINE